MNKSLPISHDLTLTLTNEGFDIDTSRIDEDYDSSVMLTLFLPSSSWLSQQTGIGSSCDEIIDDGVITTSKLSELHHEVKSRLSYYSPDNVIIQPSSGRLEIVITKNEFTSHYVI